MYMSIRYFYPHGDEFEEMKSTVKEWKSLEKAKAYCERYTGGWRFAGASIEDEKGNIVYEISDCGDIAEYPEAI